MNDTQSSMPKPIPMGFPKISSVLMLPWEVFYHLSKFSEKHCKGVKMYAE
jgi:hypothetical protein